MPSWVTLSPAGGGGALAEGSPDHRYAFRLDLDLEGRPRPECWHADPEPWRARRWWPSSAGEAAAPPFVGDVLYDEDEGWSLRFLRREGEERDRREPVVVPLDREARFRPGDVFSVTEPDGSSNAWRVVSVTPEDPWAKEESGMVEPRGVEPLTS